MARGSGESLKRHRGIAGSNESVQSSGARVHTPRRFNLGDLFLLHCLLNLPSDRLFESDCARLFKDALFLEEIIERRSSMLAALCHFVIPVKAAKPFEYGATVLWQIGKTVPALLELVPSSSTPFSAADIETSLSPWRVRCRLHTELQILVTKFAERRVFRFDMPGNRAGNIRVAF